MLPGVPLWARVPDDELPDDTVHLRNVTVTTQSYRDLIPAQTLSGRELEALRSHSVADGLRYFSGLQIKDYGGVGGIKTVNIRSMGTNHMGVYYNGIELGQRPERPGRPRQIFVAEYRVGRHVQRPKK